MFFCWVFFVAFMNRVNITYSSKLISIGDWLSKSNLLFDISYMYYTSIICSLVLRNLMQNLRQDFYFLDYLSSLQMSV